MSKLNTEKVDLIFKRLNKKKNIHESTLLIENTQGDVLYCGEYNRTIDTPILIASITKLLTSACIFILAEQNKLRLEDKIADYLNESIINKLHIYKEIDYSQTLQINHLLTQTSGLPDYYIRGKIFSKVKTQDFAFSFEDELKWIQSMKPRFAPGSKNKAYYSDFNFDLLGQIIEQVSGLSLSDAFDTYLFKPLNLKHTMLISGDNDTVPHTYFRQNRVERPQFIKSCYASGGVVSTTRELMVLIKAFWKGTLFKSELLQQTPPLPLQIYFYPIRYGKGYMHITASYPFGKKCTLLGHTGSTGALTFYCPDKEVFIVGDVAQAASPGAPARLALRSILAL